MRCVGERKSEEEREREEKSFSLVPEPRQTPNARLSFVPSVPFIPFPMAR